MAAQDDAGQFARAEWNDDAATLAHAMPQGFRQSVSERLIERNREADVAIEAGSGGHSHMVTGCGGMGRIYRRIRGCYRCEPRGGAHSTRPRPLAILMNS